MESQKVDQKKFLKEKLLKALHYYVEEEIELANELVRDVAGYLLQCWEYLYANMGIDALYDMHTLEQIDRIRRCLLVLTDVTSVKREVDRVQLLGIASKIIDGIDMDFMVVPYESIDYVYLLISRISKSTAYARFAMEALHEFLSKNKVKFKDEESFGYICQNLFSCLAALSVKFSHATFVKTIQFYELLRLMYENPDIYLGLGAKEKKREVSEILSSLEKQELTEGQKDILDVLNRMGRPVSFEELESLTGKKKSSISQFVGHLEKKGFVEKIKTPEGKVLVSLTDKGREKGE